MKRSTFLASVFGFLGVARAQQWKESTMEFFLKARPLPDTFADELLLLHHLTFQGPRSPFLMIPPVPWWWGPVSMLPWWWNRRLQ